MNILIFPSNSKHVEREKFFNFLGKIGGNEDGCKK
jgi:hypothetical protein